jgi:serine/threonine protein kinase
MQESAESGDKLGLTGSTLADRYQVDRQVGEGGYAVVYHAFQLALDRPVALKILKTPPGLDDSASSKFHGRFALEAKTIAQLKHPSVVDVYDYGVSRLASGELAPWMALEWLDGETLEANLDRRRGAGGRPGPAAVALIRPVVEALAYAHRRGVIHRDVKPANLMLVATDAGPVLRMLDFGIAKIIGPGQLGDTGRSASSGTPGFSPDYAAPEQVTYSRTGPWTDVHALGLLLTELLTDEPPFSAGEDAHTFEQVMSPTRPTPRAKGKDVGKLEKVIAKAVALSPSRRFKTAGDLLRALDAVSPPRPPSPDRDSGTTVKVQKPASRRVFASRRIFAAREAPAVRRALPAPARDAAAERRQDLAVAGAGAAILAVALTLIAWTFSSNTEGSPTSPSGELAAARRAFTLTRTGRVVTARTPSPWIVPLPAPAAIAAAEPLPPIDPAPRRAKTTRPIPPELPAPRLADEAAVTAASCSLTINSVPWSAVWIDGANTDLHTPVVGYPIPCGRHRIDFKRPDLRLQQSEWIVATPGEPFKRRFSLTTERE